MTTESRSSVPEQPVGTSTLTWPGGIAPNVPPADFLGWAAPTKRAAPPESASAPRISKKAFTSPYHEFCQAERPLLMPLGMANRDRERLLGELAP